ncbi:MAG: S4 domain-containing protein [Candidatus Marsarchaeota archaeon]|nr:S4 domain-containing protein [Candidatus Marsarchaeota archaeon]
MANKGNNRHIKSLNAPKFFGVAKKEHTYTAKPSAGRHSLQKSVALQTIVKKSSLFSGTAEAVKAIKAMEITVNGKKVYDPKYPVGLNDIINITPIGKKFSVQISKQGASVLEELKKADAERHAKVTGKYVSKANVLMLRLHDGSSIKAPDKSIAVGDTITLSESNEFKQHLPMKSGSKCIVIDGVHVGAEGKIVNMAKGTMHSSAVATIEQSNGEKFDTLVENLIVIG